MEKPVILCVDDEKVVLDSLSTQLKNYLHKEYQVEVAESGEEALEIIDELITDRGTYPRLVISDMIMPRMKGDELLSEVRKKCPDTLSILLTGQADKRDIINTINTSGLFRYISKPWEVDDLNLTVREALATASQAKEIEKQKDQLILMNRKLEKKVKERTEKIISQKKELDEAKETSDRLLLSILPSEVADELRDFGKALPSFYSQATVLFSNIVGFSQIAEEMVPEELVHELDNCFQAFDEIMTRHHLEKIKTLGDGYIAVGGVPISNESNATDAVSAALEMLSYVRQTNEERKLEGKSEWQLRIGIHTGELVAGVVGKNNVSYDIWGDTATHASRLERSGDNNSINISGTTYELVREQFECTYKGRIEAGGRGRVVTYVVQDYK